MDGQVGAGQQENEAVSVALLRIVRDADSFYVGGTKSPSWRWQGGVSDRSTKPMVGHSANWEVMKVIACRFDESAGELETFLIQKCLAAEPQRCANKVADSRGLSKSGHNWIYVCM